MTYQALRWWHPPAWREDCVRWRWRPRRGTRRRCARGVQAPCTRCWTRRKSRRGVRPTSTCAGTGRRTTVPGQRCPSSTWGVQSWPSRPSPRGSSEVSAALDRQRHTTSSIRPDDNTHSRSYFEVLRAVCLYVGQFVCLFCLFIYPLAYRTNHMSKFHEIFLHFTGGRGSVLLWQQRNITGPPTHSVGASIVFCFALWCSSSSVVVVCHRL